MSARDAPPLTPGRILYLLYHYPLGEMRRSARQGGPWQQWLDRRGRIEMQHVSKSLVLPDFSPAPPLELHQLTGRAYLFQSIFCLWSFAQAARRNIAPVFYDDGTLTASQSSKLQAIFPRGRVVTEAETQTRVEKYLPEPRFPTLRKLFENYPLIRKLINIHLGAQGWKLVLDADLLFFRRPDFLLDWLRAPRQPLHMLDVAEAYGYSLRLLEELAGPLPSRVNVGLCGLLSETLDWDQLEFWCAHLLEREGRHYLLEQALTALLLAGQSSAVAPAQDYVTLPDRAEALTPRAVMHHYVYDSKRWYFRAAWRNALTLSVEKNHQ